MDIPDVLARLSGKLRTGCRWIRTIVLVLALLGPDDPMISLDMSSMVLVAYRPCIFGQILYSRCDSISITCLYATYKQAFQMRPNLSACKEGHLVETYVRLNIVVTILSASLVWVFVIGCISKPNHTLGEMRGWDWWITQKWTWLYTGPQSIWVIFVIILYFSKYSNIKLGRERDQPEFSDGTYFVMVFGTGIGVGLFYFGIAEPIIHYASKFEHRNRYYWQRLTDNQRAQDSINLTLFHWGIHGWTVYVLIGILLAMMNYRNGLPMKIRSCFYPLLGEKIFGITGDVIDVISTVCCMLGICTSLGLGVKLLNAGMNRINGSIEEKTSNQIILVWCITVVATVSTISGIKIGIRRLSEVCFVCGMLVVMTVFFHDDTWFLLNLYVQSIGYYVQNIIQLGFHTDAFAQMNNAQDGKENPDWIGNWTIFYWGWWISWSPLLGMFIAKTSRGRTIKSILNYTLVLPIMYSFLWLITVGGAGLRMERNAAKAGVNCSSTLGGSNATASDNGLYRLSCRKQNDLWFDLMDQYGDLGTTLSIISLAGLVLYYITSSDSCSLVVAYLTSNGDEGPTFLQRTFWGLTEGACATALLKAGGLAAFQIAAIIAGLPFTFIHNFVCVALWRAVRDVPDEEIREERERNIPHERKGFAIELLDMLYKPNKKRILKILVAVVAPWWSIGKAASRVHRQGRYTWVYGVILAIPFYIWILFLILEITVKSLSYLGWTILFGFISYAQGVRGALRQAYKIDGNVIEDFFSILLVYPLAAVQMDEQTDLVPLPNNNNDNIEMGIENPMMQGEIAVIQHGDEHANVIHL